MARRRKRKFASLDDSAFSAILERSQDEYRRVPESSIRPNPEQPRRSFDKADLAALAQSVRAKGVLEPLLVKEAGPSAYRLVAGERRLRAARIAGLSEVPVLVLSPRTDERMVAMIENLFRLDLHPIEEAQGLDDLRREQKWTHAQLAKWRGWPRSAMTELLSLTKLPGKMQAEAVRLEWEMGPLLRVARVQDPKVQEELWDRVKYSKPSVRELDGERARVDEHGDGRRAGTARQRPKGKRSATSPLEGVQKTIRTAAGALSQVTVEGLRPAEAKALDRKLAGLSKAISGLRERLAR